ncbi:hypothetical protein CDD83_5666 [Cordyceps sp. RAO-2017]|nr:hypothetical protein CDD83_5666 [Cordyceps sp. RAO-2017]
MADQPQHRKTVDGQPAEDGRPCSQPAEDATNRPHGSKRLMANHQESLLSGPRLGSISTPALFLVNMKHLTLDDAAAARQRQPAHWPARSLRRPVGQARPLGTVPFRSRDQRLCGRGDR